MVKQVILFGNRVGESVLIGRRIWHRVVLNDRRALLGFCCGALLAFSLIGTLASTFRLLWQGPVSVSQSELAGNFSCWARNLDHLSGWRPVSRTPDLESGVLSSIGFQPESERDIRTRHGSGRIFRRGFDGRQTFLMILDIPRAPLLPGSFDSSVEWLENDWRISLCAKRGFVMVHFLPDLQVSQPHAGDPVAAPIHP